LDGAIAFIYENSSPRFRQKRRYARELGARRPSLSCRTFRGEPRVSPVLRTPREWGDRCVTAFALACNFDDWRKRRSANLPTCGGDVRQDRGGRLAPRSNLSLTIAQRAKRQVTARGKLLLRQPQPEAQRAGFRQRFEAGEVCFGERRVVGAGQGVGDDVGLGHGGQFVHGARLAGSLWRSGTEDISVHKDEDETTALILRDRDQDSTDRFPLTGLVCLRVLTSVRSTIHLSRTQLATRAHTVPKFYLNGFVTHRIKHGEEPYLWIGTIADGKIVRKAPTNVSVLPGYYDGPGALVERDASLEKHLAKIESAAASEIRKFVRLPAQEKSNLPAEIARFLAWQAARTPGWISLVQEWANEPIRATRVALVEPLPSGIEKIKESTRPVTLMNPNTGDKRRVTSEQIDSLLNSGWKWEFSEEDRLEAMHMQAWYFQVRHFPRLKWTKLRAPNEDQFLTSDRAVAWLADGYANTPPSALRHHAAEVVAPLTKNVALIGRNSDREVGLTARQFNLRVAMCASRWIAGPTQEVVQSALLDRQESQSQTTIH
jgi:Protein of unknown function (DUF4238)